MLSLWQEMRKDMIDRHWKSKHPSQLHSKNKFISISITGQSSLLSHGFKPNKPDHDVTSQDVEDLAASAQVDLEEDEVDNSGDKRHIDDDEDDYDQIK